VLEIPALKWLFKSSLGYKAKPPSQFFFSFIRILALKAMAPPGD
jgi:hypothetical protein